ncbi:MAG: helix-hairpin-helix domain-containing protein [Bacillota bacterium]
MKQAIMMTIILVILGWFWLFPRQESIEYIDQAAIPYEIIEVEIKGAVLFPGVYHFFEPITLEEAFTYAGGLLEDADQTSFNMSEVIIRDRQITVSSINVTIETPTVLVNVNTASFKELITIPGMTETRAASLIIYREQYGKFNHIDEIINVNNIGTVTLEKIKPYITLG